MRGRAKESPWAMLEHESCSTSNHRQLQMNKME
ncbi:hypothetical protein LEMLEM_LOCUS25634 [Lemmus lemmus]